MQQIPVRSKLESFFLNENYILGAIILNALIVFLLAFPSLDGNLPLLYFDSLLVLYFTIEAIVKIKKLGVKAYFSIGWNRFDFLIVLCSLPLLLEHFFIFKTGSTHIVTLFRLFRLLRVMRFFQFVPNINHILIGLRRAFRASIFVFIVLLFMNFIFAVLTTYLFSSTLPSHFSSPIDSAFTIFQLFTLEGWNEIPAAFMELPQFNELEVNFIRLYFAVIVLAGGIFGMSIANAIFVDEMTMDNNQALEDKIDTLQTQISRLEQLILDGQNKKAKEEEE